MCMVWRGEIGGRGFADSRRRHWDRRSVFKDCASRCRLPRRFMRRLRPASDMSESNACFLISFMGIVLSALKIGDIRQILGEAGSLFHLDQPLAGNNVNGTFR